MSFYRYSRSYFYQPQETPGTNFIIACNVATFVLLFFRIFPAIFLQFLVLDTSTVWQAPWGFFTYPLVFIPNGLMSFISLLLGIYWLYVLGGLLERSWGTQRFLLVFFGFSAISALFLSLGGMLLKIETGFGGLYLPLVDLTVIWALLDPLAQVFFFVFPMQLRWLALLVCAMLFFSYGSMTPSFGLFSLGGPFVAYLYLWGKNLLSTATRSLSSKQKILHHLNPLEWYRRWQFKRRFKKLWGE
jgi:membrane associated rhomboid family serine protease